MRRAGLLPAALLAPLCGGSREGGTAPTQEAVASSDAPASEETVAAIAVVRWRILTSARKGSVPRGASPATKPIASVRVVD